MQMHNISKVGPTSEEYLQLIRTETGLYTAEELFEFERARLTELGLAPIGMFDHLSKSLPKGLFELCPPRPDATSKINWRELMSRVTFNNNLGECDLDPSYLKDDLEILTMPSMLSCIEDGRNRLNIKCSASKDLIKQEGRFPYDIWRGYIHAVLFTSQLTNHGLDLVASSDEIGLVPRLYLNLKTSQPILGYYNNEVHSQNWGAPSYGKLVREAK